MLNILQHKDGSSAKTCLSQNVNNAEIEKLFCKVSLEDVASRSFHDHEAPQLGHYILKTSTNGHSLSNHQPYSLLCNFIASYIADAIQYPCILIPSRSGTRQIVEQVKTLQSSRFSLKSLGQGNILFARNGLCSLRSPDTVRICSIHFFFFSVIGLCLAS